MTKTNSLTKDCLGVFAMNGFKAWSVYNGGVYDAKAKAYRKNANKLRGIPDINGYHLKTGKAMYCEIKGTKTDKLSPFQIAFLEDAERAGCYVFREVRSAVLLQQQLIELQIN